MNKNDAIFTWYISVWILEHFFKTQWSKMWAGILENLCSIIRLVTWWVLFFFQCMSSVLRNFLLLFSFFFSSSFSSFLISHLHYNFDGETAQLLLSFLYLLFYILYLCVLVLLSLRYLHFVFCFVWIFKMSSVLIIMNSLFFSYIFIASSLYFLSYMKINYNFCKGSPAVCIILVFSELFFVCWHLFCYYLFILTIKDFTQWGMILDLPFMLVVKIQTVY